MPISASVSAMVSELVTLVSGLEQFKKRSWSIFDVEDLQRKSEFMGFPIVGVAYEGAEVKDQVDLQKTVACPPGAAMITLSFSIVLGVNYSSHGENDTKSDAMDLLDEIRSTVLGYSGVNTRPYRLSGESPTPGDIEGVIFYGQLWQTDVIQTSN